MLSLCWRDSVGGRDAVAAGRSAAVTAGFIGTLLATEAIKIVLGLRPSRAGRLVAFDALRGEVRDEPAVQDPQCAVCGGGG